MTVNMDEVVQRIGKDGDLANNTYTLGELVTSAEREGLSLSRLVVAEAMAKERKSYKEILSAVMAEFKHNLDALEVGLTWGKSFLLGTVGSDLASLGDRALIDDSLINWAVVNTLATEVGNHEIGLRPCAGTGDCCPYTGLIRALQQEGFSEEQVGLEAVEAIEEAEQKIVQAVRDGLSLTEARKKFGYHVLQRKK
ncbi:MAG: hypothetical protein QME90_04140 [Thermodesulfobacteriota bacterium]|nr:hypothetical protein [Thermodesulfobacteriota bacterium]